MNSEDEQKEPAPNTDKKKSAIKAKLAERMKKKINVRYKKKKTKK